MPKKFYCEYCGIYLTHSSPSGRRQHSAGKKHIQNRKEYYMQLLLEETIYNELKRNNPYLKMVGVGSDPFQTLMDQQRLNFLLFPNLLVDMMPGKQFMQNIPTIQLQGIQQTNITKMRLPNQDFVQDVKMQDYSNPMQNLIMPNK